jgi:hypothetical protein
MISIQDCRARVTYGSLRLMRTLVCAYLSSRCLYLEPAVPPSGERRSDDRRVPRPARETVRRVFCSKLLSTENRLLPDAARRARQVSAARTRRDPAPRPVRAAARPSRTTHDESAPHVHSPAERVSDHSTDV